MLSYNVADLLRAAPGTTERHQVEALSLAVPDGLELAQPVKGEIQLINSGRSIYVEGRLETVLVERCSRCLGPAQAAVRFRIQEDALPSADPEDGSVPAAEDEPDTLRLTEYHELDLEPAVRDAISLAEPIAPLCRPDCAGLCKTCGIEMNTEPGHSHPDDEIDPRLAALAGIRDRLQ